MVQRYDLGTLQPAKQRADGTLIVEAHLARSGILRYRNQDGSERIEYRPPAEVFKQDSLDTFAFVPVTNDHPAEMLTSKNSKQFSVGSVGEKVRQDGDHIAAKLVIHDESTIAAMRAGKRDVSCGYECDLDHTPGVTPDGQRYDAVQTNIVGNHLAIVATGRAGSARVRMDAGTQAIDDEHRQERRDSISMNLEQALSALATANEKLGAEKSRADAAEKTATETRKALDTETAKAAELAIRCDTADKARLDAINAGPALVRARVLLETTAAPHLKEFKMDGASDREIRLAVIKQISNADIGADKSEDYVSARFDAAIERASTSAEVFKQSHAVIAGGRAAHQDARDAAQAERDKKAKSLFIQPGAKV